MLTVESEKIMQNPAETIIDAEYADDLMLLTSTQAESLLQSLEKAAKAIGVYLNSDKI